MKIKKKTVYVGDEGFEFALQPVDDTVQIKETETGFEARYLVQDDYPESPAEWDNTDLFLVGYHNQFTVNNDKIVTKDQCVDIFRYLYRPEEYKFDKEERDVIKSFLKTYHIFGLEAYIHGGVALSLSYEGNFPDRRWDVSQLGCVFVSKKYWRTKKSARKAAIGLIEYWNQYLSGDVYGCVVEYFDKDKKFKDIDCCFGFYGHKDALKELTNFVG